MRSIRNHQNPVTNRKFGFDKDQRIWTFVEAHQSSVIRATRFGVSEMSSAQTIYG
jgi:hypothetical protein